MASIVRNTSKNARKMIKNIRNMPDATFSKFMDDVADAPTGTKIKVGDRTYTLGGTNGAWTLVDDALPGSTMRLTQLSDELSPPIVIKNGTPRVDMNDFTTSVRTGLSETGELLTPAQLDEAVKATTQQIANSPAISRLSRLDNSAQVVDQTALPRGTSNRNVMRSLTDPVRANPTPFATRQMVNAIDSQVVDGAIGNTIGSLAKKGSTSSLNVAEAARVGRELVEKVNAGASKGRFGPSVREFVKKYQSELFAVGMFIVAGPLMGYITADAVDSTTSTTPATSATLDQRAPFAAAAATQNIPNEDEARYDAYSLFLINAALIHQKDVNGCWLYDKLRGTLTKVKVLSCGRVTLDNAMDTCPTQNYAPGLDASIQSCPSTLFNPCLKSSSRRTPNATTPAVPNVCDRYVYNTNGAANGSRPAAVTGVTAIDACAGLEADQTCSTFCKADQFNLPEYMQLICINMDLPTAYADFISELGLKPVEMFSSAKANNSPPPSPKSGSALLWILGGASAILLGLVVYALIRRKRSSSANAASIMVVT
jgi:hypothetical protein